MLDTINSIRETLLKELLRNKEINQVTFDKYVKKNIESKKEIDYDSLKPGAKMIMQFINYASSNDALKYLKSLTEEQLND